MRRVRLASWAAMVAAAALLAGCDTGDRFPGAAGAGGGPLGPSVHLDGQLQSGVGVLRSH